MVNATHIYYSIKCCILSGIYTVFLLNLLNKRFLLSRRRWQSWNGGSTAVTLFHDGPVTPEVLKKIYQNCEHELPSYARPIFLRFMKELILTTTMKNRKVEMIKEGFNLNVVTDPIYVIDNKLKTYKPFTVDSAEEILQSKLWFSIILLL